ncbi:hypothetical protein E2C01_012080 [Portunus trituberculatus]|uniref:Uncharacterized protein n=1 Tax=Portunus trituberculatus TaxID=210409 RepID=A0A5B7DCW5_PORTR|nr:hypothetical protein [Portunus trituberculatus]
MVPSGGNSQPTKDSSRIRSLEYITKEQEVSQGSKCYLEKEANKKISDCPGPSPSSSFFYGGNRLRSRVLERWWQKVGARERALKVGSCMRGSRGGGGGSHRCSWLWRGGTVLTALPVPPARPHAHAPQNPPHPELVTRGV